MCCRRFHVPVLLWLAVGVAAAMGAPERGQPEEERPATGETAEQERDYWSELSPRLRSVLSAIEEANKKLVDARAKVVYERAIPLLDEEEKADGSLVFKKPHSIILKLGDPRNEDVYTDGEHWWLVSHEDRRVEIYKAAREEEFSQEAAFLDFGYGSGARELLKDYEITILKEQKVKEKEDEPEVTHYQLRLKPRKKDAPTRYSAIECEVSDRLWLPHAFTLYESDGEIVHRFDLSDIKLNTKVKEKIFHYKPRRGYTVLWPQEF